MAQCLKEVGALADFKFSSSTSHGSKTCDPNSRGLNTLSGLLQQLYTHPQMYTHEH